jgi:hypothetical protein
LKRLRDQDPEQDLDWDQDFECGDVLDGDLLSERDDCEHLDECE